MKKKGNAITFALLVIFCSSAILSAWSATPNSWTKMTPMPSAWQSANTAVVDGKIYAYV
jgi:hypothetical protein